MKRLCVSISLIAFSMALPAAGQQSQPPFKSQAELVLVPAVITEHDQPVHGLTARDFTLRDNGKPVSIAVFEEVNAIPARFDNLALPPNVTQNFVQVQFSSGRRFVKESLEKDMSADEVRQLAKAGFRHRRTLNLAPGSYEIRVLLRDRSNGNTGTVSARIEVPATSGQAPLNP